ncbi:major facilitator superfamily transporter [Pelomyxa schiedti]|nr:major facilitator superfamily transporter [Pelomyxa schiedti]
MLGFVVSFGALLAACVAIVFVANRHAIAAYFSPASRLPMPGVALAVGRDAVRDSSPEAVAFQKKYLLVYLLATAADWIQGPYVYVLYDSYGFTEDKIAHFFIMGFGSSMIFGPFVGSIADKYGRKKLAMAYCILYSISCFCKMVNSYPILLIARLFSGISTSLLFSVFESWMVCEHNRNGFSDQLLSKTFSICTFGNGFIAIFVGVVASLFADGWGFDLGYLSPFVLATVDLLVLLVTIYTTWGENYGDTAVDVAPHLGHAISAIIQDKKIIALGLLQSMFEGCMYTFVFLWSPVLGELGASNPCVLPFGLIFAMYMVCIMIGSQLFTLTKSLRGTSNTISTVSQMAVVYYLVAACAFFVTGVCLLNRESCAQYQAIIIGSFLAFETCCGMYFPTMGTLKATFLPEKSRATIMNIFRVGLNAMVVAFLTQVHKLSNSTVFFIGCGIMSTAALVQLWFSRVAKLPSVSPRAEDA